MNTLLAALHVQIEVDPDLLGSDDPAFARALERGHTFRACKGGVRWRGKILRCPEEAADALVREARKLFTQAEASGGKETATGRWLRDRSCLAAHAAHYVYSRRRKLWPAHVEAGA